MSKIISMDEIVSIARVQLEKGGRVEFTPKGYSMLPMLRNNVDAVVLEKQTGRLKKYDLPLFQQKDGQYILHRVVEVCSDGSYVMCGDNRIAKEEGITDEDIIAVVTEFERKGKRHSCTDFSYRLYCYIWVLFYPLRKPYKRVRRLLGRIKRKIKRMIIRKR